MKQLNFTCFRSSFGWVGVVRSLLGISRTVFGKSSEFEVEDCLLSGGRMTKSDEGLAEAVDLLGRYFKGERIAYDLCLDLQHGTAFQQKVWNVTCRIPYGEIRTYSWIAAAIGQPHAVRAVGRAEGANPLPIIIPCHRVLRKNGGFGGYSAGLHWKPKLLALEHKTQFQA